MPQYLLGLDVGTTNLKAVVFDTDGRTVAVARRATVTHHPRRDWSVYEAEELWQGLGEAIREAVEVAGGGRRIAGVGVASMAEAGVPLDENGLPLYPIICWHDARTRQQAERWGREFGAKRLFAITGQPLDFIYSLLKLQWLRDYEPAVIARMRHWLCMEDYAIFRLTGRMVTDYSIASRTMLFDQRRRDWSDEILEAAGLRHDQLPELQPSGVIAGHVSEEVACVTGLLPGTPVSTGGHDHLCGSLASGAHETGVLLDSAGTAESVLLTVQQPALNELSWSAGFECYSHVVRDMYVVKGGLKMSGGLVDWFMQQFCRAELEEAVRSGSSVYGPALEQIPVEPGSRGVFCLPYLGRGGTPMRNLNALGAFVGMTPSHTRWDMLGAIVEATCFWLRENLDFYRDDLGTPIRLIRSIGGPARSNIWVQRKADVTGVPVEVPESEEAVAQGAAMLAGIAVGIYSDERDAFAHTGRIRARFEPDPDRVARYDHLYQEVYRKLSPALVDVHRALTQIGTVRTIRKRLPSLAHYLVAPEPDVIELTPPRVTGVSSPSPVAYCGRYCALHVYVGSPPLPVQEE